MTNHKFRHTDLEPLENNPFSGKFHLLIVGTFNGDIKDNNALWFYGRPENEFWCLLPRTLGDNTLHPVDRNEDSDTLAAIWKSYCVSKKIIIVDIFKAVNADLVDHSDSAFWDLKENEYHLFDFKKAFANTTFDAILFTWKELNKNNLLTVVKNQYIDFFKQKNSDILNMVTPSNTYSKPRIFKLEQWRNEYDKLKK